MRKFIYCLVAILALSVYDASAQKKGDKYVSGNLGLGVTSAIIQGESVAGVVFAVEPEVGFFPVDNLMLGFSVGYDLEAVSGDTAHTLFVGPKLAYYVPLCEKLYYTPSLQVGFCLVAADGAGVPGFGLNASVFAVEYRPSERVGISGSLLSLGYNLLASDGLVLNTVDFGLSIKPSVGVKLYF